MEVLEPNENNLVERKSSIYQHRGMLAVRKGDAWAPIAFDVLDGITCKTVHSHKAVLTREDYIGYNFPVGSCPYLSEAYVESDQEGIETKVLPDFYGSGFYESRYDRKVLVNSASGALGVVNQDNLQIGLDYVTAKSSLDPVD